MAPATTTPTSMPTFVYSPMPTATSNSSQFADDDYGSGSEPGSVRVALFTVLGSLGAAFGALFLLIKFREYRARIRRREARKARMIAAAAAARRDVELRERWSQGKNDLTVCSYPGDGEVRRRADHVSLESLGESRRESQRMSFGPATAAAAVGVNGDLESAEAVRADSREFRNSVAAPDDAGAGDASLAEPHPMESGRLATDEDDFGNGPQQDDRVRLTKAAVDSHDVASSLDGLTAIPMVCLARSANSNTDDMWERRRKAKSLELLHLKSPLAYPAAVHTAASGGGKPRLDDKREIVARWIQGSGLPHDDKAVKRVAGTYPPPDRSWYSLKTCSEKSLMARNNSWKTMEEGETSSAHEDQWDCRAHEEEWEDVRTLASRPSDQSLQFPPMRAREI